MNCFTRKAGINLSVRLLAITLLFIISFNVCAQERIVSGTITGENNVPLSGASVTVKGTSRGTSTNAAGRFSISAAPDATLVISSVGYGNQEIDIAGRTDITISLTIASTELEQVVVVGYGTQRKRDLTGSITSVKGEEVSRMPNTNPISSLQGKVAGLTISTSGDAGSSPVVRIRGTNPWYQQYQ